MDYFRQISSALAKGGGPLPGITIGEEVSSFTGKTIWTLYDGVRKVRGLAHLGRPASSERVCV